MLIRGRPTVVPRRSTARSTASSREREEGRALAFQVFSEYSVYKYFMDIRNWSMSMVAEEQVIHAPSQLAQLLVGLRRQRGLSQKLVAQKAGGLSQARLSALELHPGRFTLERLLLILAALDLELVVRPRRNAPESAEW